MKKVLVTGGSGFIGSHLVDELVKDYDVYVLDNHLPGFGNKPIHPQAKLITGDIRRYEDVEFACNNIDIVVHLAALSHVSTCKNNPKLCMDINVGGTVNILECARLHKIEKTIIAASDHIYGRYPTVLPVSETDPISAIFEDDPYGKSKALQVVLAQMYNVQYKIPVVLTASGNVFSERQSSPNVIPNFIKAALQNKDLIIHGSGNQTREFYHVDNLTQGYRKLIQNDNIKSGLFNFGADNEMSINQIAQKILELIPDSQSKIVHINDVRFNAMDRMAIDISKAKQLLGYEIKISFEEGLKRTIDAYRRLK